MTNPLKKVPTPILLFGGGSILGLGIIWYRRRAAANAADSLAADTSATAGEQNATGDSQLALTPSPVAYVSPNVPLPEPAETVGAVGQTALQTLSDVFTGQQAATTALLQALITRPDPSVQALTDLLATKPEAAAAAPIVLSPPPAAPAPRPLPSQRLPAGYTHGDTIHGKKFKGAIGYKVVARDNKKGIENIHVRFPWGGGAWHYDFKGKNKGHWSFLGTLK